VIGSVGSDVLRIARRVNNIQTNQAKRAFFGALHLPADARLALHPERLERKNYPVMVT
jgi:hypothetical protein